jgi:Ca2+-binding EF-hand superfamily protein
MISELDTPDSQKKGGIDFDTFVEAINNKLGDKETKDGIRRIFNLFIDDPQQETITLSSLRRIARELGEQMSNDELKDMLERASSNGTELTFDEFYDIMTKKSFA